MIDPDDPEVAWEDGTTGEGDPDKLLRLDGGLRGGVPCGRCLRGFVAVVFLAPGIHRIQCPHCGERLAVSVAASCPGHPTCPMDAHRHQQWTALDVTEYWPER